MSAKVLTEVGERLENLAENLIYGLDLVDAVVLFALLKQAPELLTLARAIAACAELEGLADECRGRGREDTQL